MRDNRDSAALPGLVVIGSGPGGITAATAYRDAEGAGPVTVLTGDAHLPYQRPPLSKDLLQGTSSADDAALNDPGYYRHRGIDIRLGDAVTTLDIDARSVTTASGATFPYTACVIATGASPIALPVPGADSPIVHVLRSLDDANRLRDAAGRAGRAVVAGSGFIGCEVAASLRRLGVEVTLISPEMLPQESRLGVAAATELAGWLRSEGVELRLGESVTAVEDRRVRTDAGTTVAADLVVMASGVAPNSALAAEAGLALFEGRIQVDDQLRTEAADVYAVGDVAYAFNAAAGRHVAVEHWGDAVTMGEIAGRGAAGLVASWSSAPGFWSTIGARTLKYAAWGDGYDDSEMVGHSDGGFTVWYRRQGRVVGVLTHDADEDYEAGTEQVAQGASSTR